METIILNINGAEITAKCEFVPVGSEYEDIFGQTLITPYNMYIIKSIEL